MDRKSMPYWLSALLAGLMVVQPMLGLLRPDLYRDAGWIRFTWFGNDWITLAIGAPLLLVAMALARRGSTRGMLLWLGVLAYAVYNYAFYLLGAAMNAFFPLYVLSLVLASAALVLALSRLEVAAVAASFRPRTPARLVGGYLAIVAFGLSCVWFGMWAAYIFADHPAPGGPGAFQLVAALDLTMMVPALAIAGILLWRRRSWGYVLATMASIQGALYLLVLAVNAATVIRRGLVEAPGELPLWGPLAAATTVAGMLLISNVRTGRRELLRVTERETATDQHVGALDRADCTRW